MGIDINYKELSAYLSSITVMKDDYNKFLRKFLIQMAERVLARVKPRTPVVSGDLKRGWELGDIHGEGKHLTIEILNGMDYATDVEYGHRVVHNGIEVGWYNGRFMLKISIDEIQRQMPARYQSEFKQFCLEKGIEYD